MRWGGLELAEWTETVAAFFQRLDARELDHVRSCVRHTERRAIRTAAVVLNWLSNGALYPCVAALIFVLFGRSMLSAVLVAIGSIVVAHLIYPLLKTSCGRARPFECDSSIVSLLKPLDRYSFPSGHTMTATAALLPLSAATPLMAPLSLTMIVLIGWARLAAGHHYPSDVLAGAFLGGAIASPGLVWLLY